VLLSKFSHSALRDHNKLTAVRSSPFSHSLKMSAELLYIQPAPSYLERIDRSLRDPLNPRTVLEPYQRGTIRNRLLPRPRILLFQRLTYDLGLAVLHDTRKTILYCKVGQLPPPPPPPKSRLRMNKSQRQAIGLQNSFKSRAAILDPRAPLIQYEAP
jgi:hypothetical protein